MSIEKLSIEEKEKLEKEMNDRMDALAKTYVDIMISIGGRMYSGDDITNKEFFKFQRKFSKQFAKSLNKAFVDIS